MKTRVFAAQTVRLMVRLIIATIAVSAFFVVTQDFHIFPELYTSLLGGKETPQDAGVQELTTLAADGQAVMVWRMKANQERAQHVALLFHGNAERLKSFLRIQRWLSSIGITSYSMEYRGFGGWGSGWPSERGIYSDAEAAFHLLVREEQVPAQDVLILGSSIGTGTAAYIAQKFSAGILVLLSPYTSLTDVVAEMPFYGYLSPFLWYRFPTIEYIRALDQTCVVTAHGRKDTTIPFHHSQELKAAYRGRGTFTLIESDEAGHNDILKYSRGSIEKAIAACGRATESRR